MNRNIIFLPLLAFFLGSAPSAFGQSAMQLFRDLWGTEKKDMLSEYMEFSQAEANAFWPLYEEYMAEKRALSDNRVAIIRDYAENLTAMSDDKAKDLTEAVFSNDLKLTKLQKKYYKKMSKAISPLRASEFLQVERYLDTTIRSEIQESIPFIGEIRDLRN